MEWGDGLTGEVFRRLQYNRLLSGCGDHFAFLFLDGFCHGMKDGEARLCRSFSESVSGREAGGDDGGKGI